MRYTWVMLFTVAYPALGPAGLHLDREVLAELPSQWRGYLLDQRALRTLANANGLPSPLREAYLLDRDRLRKLAGERPLTADESAELGGLLIRLGAIEEALGVLRPAAQADGDHFRLHANLGTAWQLHGDLDQAAVALTQAVRLAPERWKSAERLHMQLIEARRRQPRGSQALDGVVTLMGSPPAELLANAQIVGLWLPADGRWLWQLAELAHAAGDSRTAAAMLEGCVGEFGLSDAKLRQRRQALRELADQPHADHQAVAVVGFRSNRPVARSRDLIRLPPVKPDGVNALPWMVLAETALDRKFRPTFADHLKQLDGRRVVVIGFMQPIGEALEMAQFLLIEHPVGCWYCEVPEPTGIILAELPAGQSVRLTRDPVKVTGVLKLNATDPEEFLYTIRDARAVPPD